MIFAETMYYILGHGDISAIEVGPLKIFMCKVSRRFR